VRALPGTDLYVWRGILPADLSVIALARRKPLGEGGSFRVVPRLPWQPCRSHDACARLDEPAVAHPTTCPRCGAEFIPRVPPTAGHRRAAYGNTLQASKNDVPKMRKDRLTTEGRPPVDEGLPADLPPSERRPARMRIVAGRRLAGLTAVLDGVHDAHNISAVLRSCDAFGVQNVHLIGDSKTLRPNREITRGCQKWLTLHFHPDATACAEVLHAEGFQLWAAVPDRAAKPLDELDFGGKKIALLFGNEKDGVSDALAAAADGTYFIPMAGFSQSLNVSVAAAVSLYVASATRRRALGRDTDMDEASVASLARSWIEADAARRMRRQPRNDA